MSVVVDMRRYISRRKLLHKMKEVCGAISHTCIDSEKMSSGWNPVFIFFYTHVYILPYFHWSKMITVLVSLLHCIEQHFCMNFIQVVIFLYILLRVVFVCFLFF